MILRTFFDGIIIGMLLGVLLAVLLFVIFNPSYLESAAKVEASTQAKICDAKYGANNLDFDHCMSMAK